jgi:hypothetical protein
MNAPWPSETYPAYPVMMFSPTAPTAKTIERMNMFW